MKLQDILKEEDNRTEENLNQIVLFHDGNNSPWYKAYNFSAYLMKFFPNGLSDNQTLKVTKREYSDGITTVNVGLPLTSLKKYLPNVELDIDKEADTEILRISVDLSVYEKLITFNTYSDEYSNWFNDLPVTERKQKGEHSSSSNNKVNSHKDSVFSNPITFTTIIKKILRFDYREKITEELIDFILELKNDCASLI